MTKFKIKNSVISIKNINNINNKNNNINNKNNDIDNRKKIAIYYSGRIENNHYINNKEHILKYNEKYNITHFCSLNEDVNSHEFIKIFCKDFGITDDRINIEKTKIPKNMIEDIRVDGNIYNMYSMFYHNYRCMELIKKHQEKNNMVFDIIIKYRSEIHSNDIMELDNLIEENKIYIPVDYDYGGINDQIAYGNFESMDKYSNCYNKFFECGKKTNRYHPESILHCHIKNSNLNIERVKFRYKLNK